MLAGCIFLSYLYLADYFTVLVLPMTFKDPKMVKAMPASANGDIRNVPTAMAKVRKNVAKAKEVLSSLAEYQASAMT